MKKIYIFIFVFFALNINASIYDFIKIKSDMLIPFINKEVEKMHVRINGNKMDISLLETNKPSKDVLTGLCYEAEKNGCTFYSDEYVLYIANLLYEMAGRKKYKDEFGYILYTDKKGSMNFFITAGDGIKSEIIKISTSIKKSGKNAGFDDGITHFNAADRVFSIEILSESGKTLYFANFYRVEYGDRYEIRNFYNNSFKKYQFKILKKFFDDEIDFFILERKGKNYLFVISDKQQENWIIVTG